ncbi:helix-turn-helix transcriptional regulator (plasmid) [Pedobacter sp. BS3]|uniref:helix-turn-helix transcriptional regulator n=1 Tax=Pedobacter sp. BS3 TaxID=2567937 RepID=UPI0011EF0497|nr:AraC family transcriptional regulator [Pedobacter sp. BS3]TZF85757.1 helix-turn-helix transcriptional regulator [Pedobacter sp. BS3]
MRSILRSNDIRELVRIYDYPEARDMPHGLIERTEAWDYNGIKSNVQHILLDGIYISQRRQSQTRDFILETEHDFPFLKMQFEMHGHSDFVRSKHGSFDLTIDAGRHQLFFFPEVKGQLTYPRFQDRNTLEIILAVSFLKRLFNNNLDILKHFGAGIEKNQPVFAANSCMPITPEMFLVISQIRQCTYTGLFRKVYIESKVVELLLMQIEQSDTYGEQAKSALQKSDVEKFHYLKELIADNPYKPYSLAQLSEIGGINNFKLKKGFRQLFGKTVFGYITEVRMQKARELIMQGEKSIAEIAYLSGYKNPQHFTVAFKKQFDCLPSNLKP